MKRGLRQRKNSDEGPKLDQEDLSQLQDHTTERRAARDLQEPEAQAAPGLTGEPGGLAKGVFPWLV
jgi:hypothetical protein